MNMSSQMFRVVLRPKGVTNPSPSEHKEFTVEIDTSDDVDVVAQLVAEITSNPWKNQWMDATSFRKYWEVAEYEVVDVDDAPDGSESSSSTHASTPVLETFKMNLGGYTEAKRVEIQLKNKGKKPRICLLYTKELNTPNYRKVPLCVTQKRATQFHNWLGKAQHNHQVIRDADVKEISEAIIRTVASQNPSFASTFSAIDPDDHDALIVEGTLRPGVVASELHRLKTP